MSKISKNRLWCARYLWMPKGSPECARMAVHKKQHYNWALTYIMCKTALTVDRKLPPKDLGCFYSEFHWNRKPKNPQILESFTKTDMNGVSSSFWYVAYTFWCLNFWYTCKSIVERFILCKYSFHIESQYCLNTQNNPHKHKHSHRHINTK